MRANPIGRRDPFALARYLADGSLNTTLGDEGIVITVVAFGVRGQMTPASVSEARSPWAQHPDGKLIAAGATEALNGRAVFALARFLPGWSLDHSFGRDGAVATDVAFVMET